MPKLKIDHVVSFSSEDPVYQANNILQNDPAKKWKCKSPGEKSATIVLQLEKASVISSIDIGNENSAYIEVLVTRSGTEDDYKVLLVMSSFMTPLEARQSTNVNKVRMFTYDQLSKPECEQKWDKMKVVCTQPFNRHVQYGLSFINFYTPEEKVNGTPVQATIGKFTLRPDSPDNISTGSLFARRKELQEAPRESLSAAAAIRDAASSPVCKPKIKPIAPSNKTNSSVEVKTQPRNRNELLYSKDEEEPNEKIDKIIEKKQSERNKREEDKKKKREEEVKKKEESKKREDKGESSKRKKDSSKENTPKKKRKTIEKAKKPFSQLLEGVTLVISGIQNPDRANLRTMALAMGAKYKSDWSDGCTHLICAFVNTPKFNQVKGKGKIVKQKWVEECHLQRKRLPWRRYCLDKNDSKSPESEDEIWEQVEDNNVSDSSENVEDGFDDTRMQKRIQEIQAKHKQSQDPYSQDTDEEILQPLSEDDIQNKLPNIFDFKTFFIDDTLDEDVYKTVERYIIAYKGIVAENPSADVDYYITSENNVDNLKEDNPGASFLRPDWIWECHNSQSLVAKDGYEL